MQNTSQIQNSEVLNPHFIYDWDFRLPGCLSNTAECVLKLRECTQDWTDFHDSEECECAVDGVSNGVPTNRRGCAHDSWGRYFCYTAGNCAQATRSTKYTSSDGHRAAMFRPCSPPPNNLQQQAARVRGGDCNTPEANDCRHDCATCIPCLQAKGGSRVHGCEKCQKCKRCAQYLGCALASNTCARLVFSDACPRDPCCGPCRAIPWCRFLCRNQEVSLKHTQHERSVR